MFPLGVVIVHLLNNHGHLAIHVAYTQRGRLLQGTVTIPRGDLGVDWHIERLPMHVTDLSPGPTEEATEEQQRNTSRPYLRVVPSHPQFPSDAQHLADNLFSYL